MGFADVFAGWEQAAQEHHKTLLQMDYQNKRELAQNYAKMADDPRYDQSSRNVFRQRSMHILTLGGDKKIPKELEDYTIKVQPPAEVGKQEQPGALPKGSVGAPMGMQGPDIEPPMPPPHPLMEEQPFEKQMEELRARTNAGTKFPPQKVSSVKSMDEDGQIYDYATFSGINPATGEYGMWTTKSPNPVAYAPRAAAGAVLNSQDAEKLRTAGMKGVLNNPTPEEIEKVNTILPGARLVPTGYGTYYIASATYRTVNQNGQVVQAPTNPPTNEPMAGAQVSGQATSTLPKTREQIVPRPGGKLGKVDLTTTTQMPSFVPGTPIPPLNQPIPQPQAPAPPVVAPPPQPTTPEQRPYQGLPGEENKVITDDIVQRIMAIPINKANKVSREGVITALKESGWTMPGAGGALAAAPVAPPAPAPPPQGATKDATVTPLPGAGRGLTAKEVGDGATRAGVLGTTIGRGANVFTTFDKIVSQKGLDSFLKRAQLQIVANPAGANQFSIVVANASKLSPEEAAFAADFASLGEDINVMRAITNATGFRGKEAFEVLLGQRGNLLGNPEVFKGVLKNSLRTIITQLGPLNRNLAESGYHMPINQDIFNGYKAVFGPDRKAIEAELRQDGWVQ